MKVISRVCLLYLSCLLGVRAWDMQNIFFRNSDGAPTTEETNNKSARAVAFDSLFCDSSGSSPSPSSPSSSEAMPRIWSFMLYDLIRDKIVASFDPPPPPSSSSKKSSLYGQGMLRTRFYPRRLASTHSIYQIASLSHDSNCTYTILAYAPFARYASITLLSNDGHVLATNRDHLEPFTLGGKSPLSNELLPVDALLDPGVFLVHGRAYNNEEIPGPTQAIYIELQDGNIVPSMTAPPTPYPTSTTMPPMISTPPTSVAPTTSAPPTTPQPSTAPPSTSRPTKAPPKTQKPTTAPPTTQRPTTAPPTTQKLTKPPTAPSTTQKPTKPPPTTQKPTTVRPTTVAPTAAPTTAPTTKPPPRTPKPTISPPTTPKPTTSPPHGGGRSCDLVLSDVQKAQKPLPNESCLKPVTLDTDGTITCGTHLFVTNNGTSTPGWDCFFDTNTIDFPHLWYNFVGTGKRTTITTCLNETTIEATRIAVYNLTSCNSNICALSIENRSDGAPEAQGVVANSNSDFSCLSGLGRTVVLDSVQDHTYKFYVGTAANERDIQAGGLFALQIISHEAPPNDLCTTATRVEANGSEIRGTTMNATIASQYSSCIPWAYDVANIRGGTVWYSVVGTGERMSISTCSEITKADTAIAVYENSSCQEQTEACLLSIPYSWNDQEPNPTYSEYASSWDETCNLTNVTTSTVVFDSEKDHEYNFYVADNKDRLDGTFGLTVKSFKPPDNELCIHAQLVAADGQEIKGTTLNARISSNYSACINDYEGIQNIRGGTVWYLVNGTGERIRITTCSELTNFSTMLSVYSNADCSNDECMTAIDGNLAFNDNDMNCQVSTQGASTVEFDSEIDHKYKFSIWDTVGRVDGSFGLTVTSFPAPPTNAPGRW